METLISDNNDKGKYYYWAYAVYQGRLLIDGYYLSEQQAYSFASRRIPVRFDVVCLDTMNEQRATHIIKHQVLEQTGDLDFALKRAKHKL